MAIFTSLMPYIAFASTPKDHETEKKADKVYIFGVGSAFGDTIIHFTSIIEMENITLEKKTGFLPYRSVYSMQLKAYLEGTLGLHQQTCCVMFSTSKKKISKKYYKLKKAYLKNSENVLKIIGENEFAFKTYQ
jgi:hypothetical protein